MMGVVGSSLKMVKFEPTSRIMLQQGGQTYATCYTQQSCDVELACCDRLAGALRYLRK